MTPPCPLIMRSDLTNPPRWFIVTKYEEREAINASTGEPSRYLFAKVKYDVTAQMEAILAAYRPRKKR